MPTKILLTIATAVWIGCVLPARAALPTPDEMAEAQRWVAARFGTDSAAENAAAAPQAAERPPFFSFTYNQRPSSEFLARWPQHHETRVLDQRRVEHTLTFTDPETGLVVRCRGVAYRDFPTVEWTLYFENTGTKDTPILANIQAIDALFPCAAEAANAPPTCRLHHNIGSPCLATDYQPLETPLAPNAEKRIATEGGRPTNSNLPYFNLQLSDNEGVIIVASWAGQWASQFLRDNENLACVRAGQELTHFKLLPGEEVRSPMIVLQFWKGDRWHAQNVWRQWMLTHNTPRPGGQPIKPMMSVCTGNSYPGIITNAAEELHFLRRYVEEGIVPDYWWQDAGWYPCDSVGWPKTGTWEVEPKRWPKGIREVSDWCKSKGIKTIVWFEPERVHPDTWLTEHHPEWIHGGKNGGLLDLGNAECRKWLVDHIDRLLTVQGIDLYRQDFNIDPLSYWRAADAEDRQGITEIRHVEGYFAYWDELLRRHPGMLIDSCASGGRRNDLETLRRAVPLLRSDYLFEPVGEQNHTYGIAAWIPFYGTGFMTVDPYLIRSQMSPEFTIGVDTRPTDQNYDLFRKMVREWKDISPCFLGDYYPLTPYGTTNDIWMAWQFDRPGEGDGVVQAFRRAQSSYEAIRVKLHGLDPAATYELVNRDVAGSTEATGRDLLEKGLSIPIGDQPGAVIITYRKKS
jgi:alpha-galactosidase